MDQKNKEKIKGIITRPFRSLPIAQDLPRLVTQMRVYEGDKMVYPSNASIQNNPNFSNLNVTKNLFDLVSHLSRLLVSTEQEQKVQTSFPEYFKLWMNATPSSNGNRNPSSGKTTHEGIDKLQDSRLKEALLFLVSSFAGSSSDASFLFNVDKPTAHVLVCVSAKGVIVLDGSNTANKPDCTISGSSAVLTAILTGTMDPNVAFRAGHLIVDNLPKLVEFSQVFKLEKKGFEAWKQVHKIAPSIEDIQQAQQDTTAIGQTLCKFFTEVLGDDNRVVKLLKACTSATISPAIIELKMTLGTHYMTKDVSSSWKFDIHVSKDKTLLKTRKSEQDLKNLFAYTWELELAYVMNNLECEDVQLRVLNLALKDQCTDSQKEDIKKILGAYGTPMIVPADTFVALLQRK